MGSSSPISPRFRWHDRLAAAVVVIVSLALLLGEAGRLNWLLELASHFLVQYFLALVTAVAYFLLRRRWRWVGFAALLLLIPAWRLAPYAPPAGEMAAATAGTHRIRVMTINVHASSDRYDLVRAAIERLDPDVILLPENTDRWAAGLAPLRARYPYIVDGQSPSVFSLFLFSRLPLSDAAIIKLPNPDGFPAIVARVCLGGGGRRPVLPAAGRHPPTTAAPEPDSRRAVRRVARPSRGCRRP